MNTILFLVLCWTLPASIAAIKSDHLRLAVDTVHFPFLHGVASADPLDDSVLLWTRVAPNRYQQQEQQQQVEWRIWEQHSADTDKETLWETTSPLQQGVAKTSSAADYTVTIDVSGLKPGTHYYYQFQDASQRRSVVGTTKTSSRDLESVNIAVLSCTSLWSGYFNMYRHLAQRTDIELILHLGDFIYPEVDPDELYRIPYGLCPTCDWFNPTCSFQGAPSAITFGGQNSAVHGRPEDNTDPYLVQLMQDFPHCEDDLANATSSSSTTVDLERYRWMYNLYLMDPDLRAARANHPMVVQFDNHDLGEDLPSLEVELERGHPGSVQAGLEWVPQRVRHNTNIQRPVNASWEDNGILSVDLLRRFQYGQDNLLDIILMDTASYSGGPDQKRVHGMLGEGQREWLQTVLTNSTQSNYTWRILGSGKAFMPITINKIGWALWVPIAIGVVVFGLMSALLIFCEVGWMWSRGGSVLFRERERARSLEMDLLNRSALGDGSSISFSEDQDDDDDFDDDDKPLKKEPTMKVAYVLQNVQKARRQSPPLLNRCSRCFVRGVFVWPVVTVLIAILVGHLINKKGNGGLLSFDNHPVVWSGRHESVVRFFDQLEATGADSNNIWVTGDAHVCYASDVFRYDPYAKDILEYNPHKGNVKRYGVEVLPCSGTRGNLNEMIGSILPMFHPKYAISRFSTFIAHSIVTIMNGHFRYFNGDDHGYGLVRVSPSEVETTFFHFPILRVTDHHKTKTLVVRHGQNKWE